MFRKILIAMNLFIAPVGPAHAQQVQYWYYCVPAKAYYPYVTDCSSPWQQVYPQSSQPSAAATVPRNDIYRPSPGEQYGPETYCEFNRSGLPEVEQRSCLDFDAKHPPKIYKARPGEVLTKLLQTCATGASISCNADIFQKVWLQIEAENGEVTEIDMNSITRANGNTATAAVYTSVPNTIFDPTRVRLLVFDCAGRYMDGTTFPPVMHDAPPRSVAGAVAGVVCSHPSSR